MSKKVIRLALSALLLALGIPAEAQQTGKKIRKIGYLSVQSPPSERNFDQLPLAQLRGSERFIRGLRELGWVEGQNLIIERRYAKGKEESLPGLAAELVHLKVEVIVAADSAAIRPAAQATSAIPIVMTVSGDPVGTGYAASLGRPGGNITGLSNVSPDLAGKRLELLKEVAPKLTRVAVLGPPSQRDWREIEIATAAMGITLQALKVQRLEEFEGAFEVARKGRAGGLIVLPSPFTNPHRKRIVALAAKTRLPAMYGLREYVEAGGLIAYGPNIPEMYRRAAYYVDRILKGTKPADLPIEQPMKFEFIINLKAAKQIGLTIPPNVLVRADKVIK